MKYLLILFILIPQICFGAGVGRQHAPVKCPQETEKHVTGSTYTVGTSDSCECYGGVIIVDTASTVTACDNLAEHMNFALITRVASAVHGDTQADNSAWLDTATIGQGDKISSGETIGEVSVWSWSAGTTWDIISDGWSDGGP